MGRGGQSVSSPGPVAHRVELQKVRKKVTCRGRRLGVEPHERYGGAICDLGAAKVANSLIAHPADEGLRGLAQVLTDQHQLVLRVRPREDGPPTDQLCERGRPEDGGGEEDEEGRLIAVIEVGQLTQSSMAWHGMACLGMAWHGMAMHECTAIGYRQRAQSSVRE